MSQGTSDLKPNNECKCNCKPCRVNEHYNCDSGMPHTSTPNPIEEISKTSGTAEAEVNMMQMVEDWPNDYQRGYEQGRKDALRDKAKENIRIVITGVCLILLVIIIGELFT